jgi:16S rRNA C967 or C1407 C5-methylase (RsmB/RsmF family)
MQNTGCIVANDIRHQRLKALRGNLQRCGVINAIVTKSFGEYFWKFDAKFSKILLDVPCSATGTFNPRIWQETSHSSIVMLSRLQKKLLESAEKMLERDGVIVYSTCSLEPEENEENIDFAVRKLGLSVEKIKMKLKDVEMIAGVTEWNNKTYDEQVADCVRVVPNERMEGFFVCMLRK